MKSDVKKFNCLINNIYDPRILEVNGSLSGYPDLIYRINMIIDYITCLRICATKNIDYSM